MSAQAPPAPRRKLKPWHVLAPVAFAAVGWAAVWLGFGLAGYGLDVHTRRVLLACLPLVVCGWLAVRPGVSRAVRAVAPLVGLAGAAAAWWYVPDSEYKSRMSLRDAVQLRAAYDARFANPTVEEWDRAGGLAPREHLLAQYPVLGVELWQYQDRWAEGVTYDIVTRFEQTAADDVAAGARLRASAERLADARPESRERLDEAIRTFVARAAKAKLDELRAVESFDAFNDTAPGRHALAGAFPEARPVLVAAEEAWAVRAAEQRLAEKLPGDRAPVRVKCLELQKALLDLKALDTSPGRFKEARRGLFVCALAAAKADVAARHAANEYDAALSIAVTHAFDWNATAALLGKAELQALAELRETCAFLAKRYERAREPVEVAPPPARRFEVAPPPRLKPDVAPPPRPKP